MVTWSAASNERGRLTAAAAALTVAIVTHVLSLAQRTTHTTRPTPALSPLLLAITAQQSSRCQHHQQQHVPYTLAAAATNSISTLERHSAERIYTSPRPLMSITCGTVLLHLSAPSTPTCPSAVLSKLICSSLLLIINCFYFFLFYRSWTL